MRTKDEILEETQSSSSRTHLDGLIEVLIDIRDLLERLANK